MILAGDIGGTKTRLGLFDGHSVAPVASETFVTAGFEGPADMIESFLASVRARATRASFGVAGPVLGGRVQPVNVPWPVDSSELERQLGMNVHLVNDIEANARGIAALDEHDFAVLNPGAAKAEGTRAVVSAGTCLGEAALWWDGTRHRPAPSEGGSASFAPSSPVEVELYRFLAAEQDRVTCGDVCSGPGLRNLYRFLSGGSEAPAPAAIATEAEADRTSVASAAVDLFVSIYGARAGDVALSYGASGGVYLGGGIAPKLLPRFLDGGFMRAFLAKGRFSRLLQRIPVRVVLNADAALVGAALFAQEAPPVERLLAA